MPARTCPRREQPHGAGRRSPRRSNHTEESLKGRWEGSAPRSVRGRGCGGAATHELVHEVGRQAELGEATLELRAVKGDKQAAAEREKAQERQVRTAPRLDSVTLA